jgi:hypothetical protein
LPLCHVALASSFLEAADLALDMPVKAGDMAGFEYAPRALFANHAAKFRQ